MTFKKITPINGLFIWIWLPDKTSPVVAGQLVKKAESYHFNYGRSYLENPQAISLSAFELPLQQGVFIPEGIHHIHSCLRDAAPDAWGRRLIEHEYSILNANELDYMILSGSNRIGALDFQLSSTEYIPREVNNINIEDFLKVIELVEQDKAIPEEFHPLLLRGTSIGGARPKALFYDNKVEYIAKFSLSTDIYDVIKAEYIAMRLAKLIGLQVAAVKLHSILKKNILLIERFDRLKINNKITRRLMLSGLSLLGLDEMEARYASYLDFASIIRQRFTKPKVDLLELYNRLIFNILIGNTDDHARNTSAFWNGEVLKLTPAYDLCPQMRAGQITTQAMQLNGVEGNYSTLKNVLSICDTFQLTHLEAKDCIGRIVSIIEENWLTVCEEADISAQERTKLWGRAIFNPFCFEGWK